jgi:hypothetical protein
MGFYSWRTADTKESIHNVESATPHTLKGSIYLLQPNGEPPIQENAYAGYSMFGGVNARVWLALKNSDSLKLIGDYFPRLNNEFDQLIQDMRDKLLGKDVDSPELQRIIKAGLLREVSYHLEEYSVLAFGKNKLFDPNTGELVVSGYNGIPRDGLEPIEKYGNKSRRQLLDEEFFDIRDSVPEFPLKFSFDKNAVYEQLPASEVCPDQGFISPGSSMSMS